MRVTLFLPGPLRPFAEGRDEVVLEVAGPAPTVSDVLTALGERHPGVRERVLLETGEVRPHVQVFVGDESIRYLEGLATPVPAGAVVSILPAVSGGKVVTVLFACVHNAGRSQMAAAFFNRLADPARARALSGGTEPAERVHPEVVAAMREVGIDLSGEVPKRAGQGAVDHLITMGCGDACPAVPRVAPEDWPIDDPKGQPMERVRAIRDDVRARVAELVRRLGVGLTLDRDWR